MSRSSFENVAQTSVCARSITTLPARKIVEPAR